MPETGWESSFLPSRKTIEAIIGMVISRHRVWSSWRRLFEKFLWETWCPWYAFSPELSPWWPCVLRTTDVLNAPFGLAPPKDDDSKQTSSSLPSPLERRRRRRRRHSILKHPPSLAKKGRRWWLGQTRADKRGQHQWRWTRIRHIPSYLLININY